MHEGYDFDRQVDETKNFKKVTDWIGHKFESSCVTTYEFSKFARQFRSYIKKHMPTSWKMLSLTRGHFFLSGFIQKSDGQIIYFSAPDVRYDKDGWFNRLLIRTAKSDKDYSGGANRFTSLTHLFHDMEKLEKEQTW